VTPTNLLFNIVAIPGGVYRLYREKRMIWPLVWTIAAGTVPGLLAGVIIRVALLPDPDLFKFFVGLVLLYITGRLGRDIFARTTKPSPEPKGQFEVTAIDFSIKQMGFEFAGTRYRVPTVPIFTLSAAVGMIGGIYGIGGGALLAPVLVTFYRLPVYTVAGAALASTFLNSVLGVIFYVVIAPMISPDGTSVRPDWLLGAMFGLGGAAGIYIGARIQKYLPATLIKVILGLIMLYISGRYIWGFLTG
jgi:uncharacterized membrane protein YfcA